MLYAVIAIATYLVISLHASICHATLNFFFSFFSFCLLCISRYPVEFAIPPGCSHNTAYPPWQASKPRARNSLKRAMCHLRNMATESFFV
ncbi:hypothetical protein F4821DRAFT_239538 [Hypoxylon rubiginosum]|uniref:Uncharacterized protein n=1 Tax=Hypoxylon rubiginosum TaxID=110542 RepID=A0ACC0D0C7_9PEZI|nr:hypothetical protein F4821DRAFT_239538 [Hypoxylon rubiginosum]